MDELTAYINSINPQGGEKTILIYGSEYKLWREEEYLGTAIWTQDNNVGDSFQTSIINESGQKVQQVYIADRWEMLVKPQPSNK